MSSPSVLFVGLARDCEASAEAFVRALERLVASGASARAVVGENGSQDGTRAVLSGSPLVEVVDTDVMTQGASRLERMALGRQLLVESVGRAPEAVVAVVDIDEPFLEALGPAQIADAADRLMAGDVFAVGATSRPVYYDLLAYRGDNLDFVGLDRRIDAHKRTPIRYYRLFRDQIYPAQRNLTRSDDFTCLSSFNGLVFYRASDFRRGSYLSATFEASEHIPFHESLAKNTGIEHMVVAAELVLPMPREHGPRGFWGFWWQRVRAAVRGL